MPNPIANQAEALPLKRRANLVALVAFLCAVVCGVHAQRVEIPSIRSDSFTLTQPQLRVSLQQPRGNDYVIGILIDPNLRRSGSLEVGDFVTTHSANARYREFQSFSAIARDKIEIGNNSITVSGLDDCQGSVFVMLTVPIATKVVVSVNGKTEFTGTSVKGAIINRGQIVASEFLGRHQLFSRLLFPDLDNSQIEFVKTKSRYVWGQDALNKHLLRFNNPPNHPESIGGELETVTMLVKINTAGNVILATPLNGREPFVTESVNAVGQARFTPFVVNGSAVEASGDVTVVFSKDGRVSSTLK